MSDPDSIPQPAADSTLGLRVSVKGLARSGAIAGVIKLASAGLSFLMFVVVAMITDERQFGLFSATYAGASLVSFFASVGQQSTVLRFWPEYAGAGDLPSAHSFMARAIQVTIAGLMLTSLAIAAIGFIPGLAEKTPEWLPLALSAAILSFALGWSEFASGAFRAKSALISGLLPRDIIWRAGTIVIMLAMRFTHIQTTAVIATLITAGILIVSTLPQAFVLLRDTVRADRGRLTPAQKAEFTMVTLGLWGATSLPPALGQVSTLLVAAILGPEAAGAVFVADRTTRLVVLALTGINQALAPEISAAFHSGDKAHVQRITSLTALGSGIIALLILASFWLLGPFILSIFDPAYATPTMHAVLVIFGTGAAVAAACGPIELVLQLTGLQHSLLKLLVVVNIFGLAITALTAHLFGPIGAASSIGATVIIWNVTAVLISYRSIGINPSITGLFSDLRSGKPQSVERSVT
ncbi:MAG TPA: lipopolysaccharide biosynthesis protein [Arsenicitalea sp.]|nr:lipopolysaccharide biosynthesis protein [Arsenicitalea sp.]